MDQDFFKISFFFLRRVGLVDQDRRHFVTSCSSDVQNCGEMLILKLAQQPSRHFVVVGRPKLHEVKCKFLRSPSQPSRHFVVVGRPKGEMRILHVAVATLSSFPARRTSKTEVKCESAFAYNLATLSSFRVHRASMQNCGETQILTSTAQPSRHFVLVRCPKLW